MASGPQAQAWSGEMEVELLTLSCHLLRPGRGTRCCSPAFSWPVPHPGGTTARPRALMGVRRWQTGAQTPSKQHPGRQMDPQGFAELLPA